MCADQTTSCLGTAWPMHFLCFWRTPRPVGLPVCCGEVVRFGRRLVLSWLGLTIMGRRCAGARVFTRACLRASLSTGLSGDACSGWLSDGRPDGTMVVGITVQGTGDVGLEFGSRAHTLQVWWWWSSLRSACGWVWLSCCLRKVGPAVAWSWMASLAASPARADVDLTVGGVVVDELPDPS